MDGLTVSPTLIVAAIVVLYIISSIQILAEYERGVIFRLGKLLPRPKGPARGSRVQTDRSNRSDQPANRRP
jgi:hypothetical protein